MARRERVLTFEDGAGIPEDGEVVHVRRFRSRTDGEIAQVGAVMFMPPALVRALHPGHDEIVIATGPHGRLQLWGFVATGLYHDRTEAHRHWKPAGWTG